MKHFASVLLLVLPACGGTDEDAPDTGATTSDGGAPSGGTAGTGGETFPEGGASSAGATSSAGEAGTTGNPTIGCSGPIVASCSTATVCSDYHGGGYTADYVTTICDGASGTLKVGEGCDRSGWASGCVQDIAEENRCKVAWRAESLEEHESLCAWYVIPAE